MAAAALVFLAAACSADAERVVAAGAPVAWRGEALAALPGVQTIHRDVALVCDPAPAATADTIAPGSDSVDAIPDCDAVILGEDGVARPLRRGGLLAAQRFGGEGGQQFGENGEAGGLLLLRRDLTLVVHDRAGRERVVATAVADPRVADDGRRVAFAELPPGTTELAPGLPTRLVLLDLAAGTRRVITDDPLASAPFIVPGSDDIIYVSSRTGIASLWLAVPGRPPRQLTNIGLRRVPPGAHSERTAGGWTPVPARDLAWEAGTRRAIFTASYDGTHELWSIDVDTGAAARLGPGRWSAAAPSVIRAHAPGATP